MILFAVNECPNFINLNTLTGQIAKCAVLIFAARAARVDEQSTDSVFARQRRNGTDRLSFAEQMDDLGARSSMFNQFLFRALDESLQLVGKRRH